MKIKPEWILWGVGAGVVLLVLNSMARGGVMASAGSAVGRLPFDFAGGVVDGVSDGAYNAFDSLAGVFGASDSDCAKAKAAGDATGVYLKCWPKDWPVFN